MHFPFLPLEDITVNLEANTFGLYNMEWFNIVSQLELGVVLGNEIWKEVDWC